MDKKAKRYDRLQNLTIAVLSFSFILLLVQTPLFGGGSGTTLSSAVRGWFADRQTTEEDVGSLSTLAVPVRIVQTNDFIRSGTDALTTADDGFETVGSFLGEAIGSAHSVSSVSEDAFLAALDSSGIYFAFACGVPLEVLSARLGVQPPTTRQLDVYRCLLSVDGTDSAMLYLQDAETRSVYRFSTAVSSSSVKEYLEAQEGGSVDFARSLGEEYASLSPYTLVFDSVSARAGLSAANVLSDYSSEELLRRAEFNPHTKDRYVESSGTEVVVEGQRKLYLHTDGTLSYSGGTAEEGSLFAVAAADAAHVSRAEFCTAARSLIGTLTQGRIGDAALFLSGIETDDAGAAVFFDYMVNGTPVRFADGVHAAEVRIEGQSITGFSLRLRRYTLTERESLLLPLTLSRAIARRYPGCELTVAYVDSYGESVSASWIAD